MTPELLKAIEIARDYREYYPGTPGAILAMEAYYDATELLAREFVRLLDAGELVRVRQLNHALGVAIRVCEGLSEQQAMPDDWYVAELEQIRSVYNPTAKGDA